MNVKRHSFAAIYQMHKVEQKHKMHVYVHDDKCFIDSNHKTLILTNIKLFKTILHDIQLASLD